MAAICVPSDIVDRLDLPPDVEALTWDAGGDPPEGTASVEFWVPSYMSVEPGARTAGLAAMPKLRVIQLLSAGVEAWLSDVPDGVTLCNGRGIHGSSTAELAVTGLLALLRRIPTFVTQQQRAEWRRVEGETLAGKRLLVLGAGDIGEHVAAAAQVLGASATLVARRPRDRVRPIAELAALLPEHDVVVIALPHTPETHRLVDAAFLGALPDGAVVVNVARGQIVDTGALLAELTSGRLRAVLDVTDPEPLPADHPLWQAPNLLITPHVGGGVPGWPVRAAALVSTQVRRYLAGEPLANVVSEGY